MLHQRQRARADTRRIAGELRAPGGWHVGSIFAKVGVRDRPAAIVFAYDHGVVTPGAALP
jgi:hypothetical protein